MNWYYKYLNKPFSTPGLFPLSIGFRPSISCLSLFFYTIVILTFPAMSSVVVPIGSKFYEKLQKRLMAHQGKPGFEIATRNADINTWPWNMNFWWLLSQPVSFKGKVKMSISKQWLHLKAVVKTVFSEF